MPKSHHFHFAIFSMLQLPDGFSLCNYRHSPVTLRGVIARVTLEIALRKEFDYIVTPELVCQVEIGTRVKVPFGPRQVMGCVTALPERSTHTNMRSNPKVVWRQSLITPK